MRASHTLQAPSMQARTTAAGWLMPIVCETCLHGPDETSGCEHGFETVCIDWLIDNIDGRSI